MTDGAPPPAFPVDAPNCRSEIEDSLVRGGE
jgi:hypothetical protein